MAKLRPLRDPDRAMNVRENAHQSALRAHKSTPEAKADGTDAFAVSASSSLSDLRPLVLKHSNTFGVFDSKGDALASPGGTQGVYYCDTPVSYTHLTLPTTERV